MLFENQQIDTNKLPKLEEVEYLPLLNNYKYLVMIQWTIFVLFLAGLFLGFHTIQEESLPFISILGFYSGLTVLYILRLFLIIKAFPLKGYSLRQHDIIFRTGLIIRKITSIPFNRIQHSEVRQSFLARLLKITRLKIYTAGGSTSDLSIHGLSPNEAARIKDFLSKTVASHE
ncbi:MAG: PH domain-containing protein [Bacteroidales bacterium]|nr:PH domain-containing protein [Bacteroidales bacterium]MCF8456136.1 PH domain-containing protein [Bacteroidales bacterium]